MSPALQHGIEADMVVRDVLYSQCPRYFAERLLARRWVARFERLCEVAPDGHSRALCRVDGVKGTR